MRGIEALRLAKGSGSGGGGGGGSGVNIFDLTASDTEKFSASASYSLATSGIGSATGNANWNWLLSGLNSDYQVRATLTGGSLSSGITGSWVSLSTFREWTVSNSGSSGSTESAGLKIEIRRVVDSVIIDTANIGIDANIL